MTAIDAEALARLRSLLAKATPGPWKLHECKNYGSDYFNMTGGGSCASICDNDPYGADAMDDDNMRLVAAAVNALPALLDIAEAVARSPVARIETDGFADDGMPIVCLAADSIKAERAIKKMHMLRVRIVPCTGGGE